MESKEFWVKRFLWMTGIVFMILMAASLFRGREMETALSESFMWGLISSAIFTGWRYRQARKGVACAMCRDTPED
jgi:hypothetical protein